MFYVVVICKYLQNFKFIVIISLIVNFNYFNILEPFQKELIKLFHLLLITVPTLGSLQ